MYDLAPAASTSDTAAPVPSGAAARMAMLRKTAEIGVRLAERLDRQSELAAVYAETCAVPEHLRPPYGRRLDEIARAFAPVARAIALAVALEDRLEADHRAGPAAAADCALKRELAALRADVARAAAAAAPPDGADAPGVSAGAPGRVAPAAPRPRLGALDLDLDRLADGGLADLDAWLRRPPDQVIAHIRAGLGLGEGPAAPPAPPAAVVRRDRGAASAAGAMTFRPPRAASALQRRAAPDPAPPDPGEAPGPDPGRRVRGLARR